MASLYQAPYFSDSPGGCCPLWRDPNLLQPRGENNTINHTINHHQKKTINHHPHFFFEKLAPSPNGLLFQLLNLNGWKQCPRPLQFDLIIFWKTQSQLSSSIIRRKKQIEHQQEPVLLDWWCGAILNYFPISDQRHVFMFYVFRSEACSTWSYSSTRMLTVVSPRECSRWHLSTYWEEHHYITLIQNHVSRNIISSKMCHLGRGWARPGPWSGFPTSTFSPDWLFLRFTSLGSPTHLLLEVFQEQVSPRTWLRFTQIVSMVIKTTAAGSSPVHQLCKAGLWGVLHADQKICRCHHS